ncbi:MAG: hypothetical protein MN733_28790 [Nitrososphaera sp.]|nr:hypothetical protein [Nitrososphaera sp.]
MNVLCCLLSLALFGPGAAIALADLAVEENAARAVIEQVGVGDTHSVPKLWEDDFSGSWTKRWPLWWIGAGEERTSTFEYDGETWLRVTYPEGEVGKGFKFMTDHGLRDRMYLQYKVRFAEDFDWMKGGKLPGFLGGSVKAGVKPTGEDGWLVRFMWGSDGVGFAYVYHPDMPGRWGEGFSLGNFWFQKGVVQTLGLEVVLNTPGQHDGVIRAWLDGVLVVEETSMRFRDIPELQINGVTFATFFGGNDDSWAPTKDEHIDFGDFKLYEAPPWESGNLISADPL